MLLWPATLALIRPLTWKPPYASGVVLKRPPPKKKEEEEKEKRKQHSPSPTCIIWPILTLFSYMKPHHLPAQAFKGRPFPRWTEAVNDGNFT